LICGVQERLEVKITPNNLVVSILSMPGMRGISCLFLVLSDFQKMISLVLFSLILSFIAADQSTRDAYSVSMGQSEFCGTKRDLSSAYFISAFSLEIVFNVLAKVMYRNGPIPEPCTMDLLIRM
jgi:uncharacterized membrane protein